MTAEPTAARAGSARRPTPTLRTERALISSGARLVAGMDEVGRGALAGPVSVGVVVVDAATRTAPKGVADSKLLTPAAREALVPQLQRWPVAWAVGHAGPAEIDAHGIIAALRIAGRRALSQVRRVCGDVDLVLLDGSHDWLTRPQADLFEAVELDVAGAPETDPTVRTLVKADLQCASVAAASVLAKVERDLLLTRLARQYPAYAWDQNKGYSAPAHLDALRLHGTTPQHRRSWNLRSTTEAATPGATTFGQAVAEGLDVWADSPAEANLRG
ncbi:Ribonuclease H [Xylanimonas cellulosilytica DSM 15894]|uniref:Ribonuclease n=1 Tax=Xylanimonas cellulosilytica (strain DSM 15894 / JCM 12276 / CECT 5975 / KCTC 9989 / LMG 20990 / NBRC 107835 / XIL07) TaxID=446471 RepID=D1BZQ0_XYLCX|nr:ribonuclease HII [Xylanimonas cellulosilytica]ACZ30204.1 Ribonuclease H [Xylanimonas cellulosilytica DSM 15894]